MKLSDIYRCLADETRLRLLHLLNHGSLGVSDLERALNLPQAAVSKHLAYLRGHGLVDVARDRQRRIFSLPVHPSPELYEQLRCLERCVAKRRHFGRDLQRWRALQPRRPRETRPLLELPNFLPTRAELHL